MRLVGVVSTAHFVSHLYILILAPLLPFVRDAYHVNYTQLGLALAAFNVISAVFQTPAGFLVDWLGARMLLIIGLALGGIAFVLVGLVNSFWFMVAMFALAGVGNTVYHPADYALLSQHVPAKNIGQAFSIHTFAGMLGSAAAPAGLLMLQSIWGWRGAFIGAGFVGLAVALLILAVRDPGPATQEIPVRKADDKSPVGWQLLLSTPIVLNLLILHADRFDERRHVQLFSRRARRALWHAGRNRQRRAHHAAAALGLRRASRRSDGLAYRAPRPGGEPRPRRHGGQRGAGRQFRPCHLGLVAVMTVFGFFFGFISPSRDMIVREVTPPGSFGKVFGFVTTGFNIGGIISPMIFGALMDTGHPRLVFLVVAAFALIAVLTVATLPKGPAKA